MRRRICFNPIDLIPDPITVLGYLDDLVLIPLSVAPAARMIPAEMLEDCQQRTQSAAVSPANRAAAVFVVAALAILAAISVLLMAGQ